MLTQKIIYACLISLLAFSLLIPTLSAGVPTSRGKEGMEINVKKLDKDVVVRPTTDVPEIVRLEGDVTYKEDGLTKTLRNEPVYIEVRGPEDYYWEPRFIGRTEDDGSFEFEFNIEKTAPIGEYKVTVSAGDKERVITFTVVPSYYDVVIENNLPEYISTTIFVDDPYGQKPKFGPLQEDIILSGGKSSTLQFGSDTTHLIEVPLYIEDPENPNWRWVCNEPSKEVSGETDISFKYEKQIKVSIIIHPSEISRYYFEQGFGTDSIELDGVDNARAYVGSTSTFIWIPEERISVNDEKEFIFNEWKFGPESYKTIPIEIPYTKVESEIEPHSLEIYYNESDNDYTNLAIIFILLGAGILFFVWLYRRAFFRALSKSNK